MKDPTRLYTAFLGIVLLLQGASTLAFRLYPPLDEAFPALLAITQMVPPHSLLHILTGVIALLVLFRGGPRGTFWFAALFGAFYFGLAIFGMLTGHATLLHLQPFDHPVHLVLGALGLLAAGIDLYQSQKRSQVSA
jgi:hypothetical protein